MFNSGMLGGALLKNAVFSNITFYDAGTGAQQSFFIITWAAIPSTQRIKLRVVQDLGGAPVIVDIYLGAGVHTYDSGGGIPLNNGTVYDYVWWVESATSNAQRSNADGFTM